MAHNCIQQLTPESVRLIYTSGSDVPKNLLRSRVVCGGGGGYCRPIISPAGALSGFYVY